MLLEERCSTHCIPLWGALIDAYYLLVLFIIVTNNQGRSRIEVKNNVVAI